MSPINSNGQSLKFYNPEIKINAREKQRRKVTVNKMSFGV
jgi:hypothetical protein